MPKAFKKTILKSGQKLRPPGAKEPLEVTNDRLVHWADQFDKMAAANTQMPLSFRSRVDHAKSLDEMKPIPKDEEPGWLSAGNAAGFLRDVKLSDDMESLEIGLEIHGDEVIRKVEDNSVFVSPVIVDKYTDGDGHKWEDVILAADIVNLPVDRSQSEFKPVETKGADLPYALTLSTAGQFVTLGTDPEQETQPPEEKGETTTVNPDSPPDPQVKQKAEAIVQNLSALGVELPSDFQLDGENSQDILLAALKTAAKAKEEKTKETEMSENTTTQPKVEDPQQVVAMSTTAFNWAQDQFRGTLKSRLDEVLKTGRCTPAEHEAHAKDVETIVMKFSTETQTPEKPQLQHWLESREAVPEGTFWTEEQKAEVAKLSTLSVEHPVNDQDQEATDEELDAVADEIMGIK